MVLEKIFFSYSRADASDFALKLALDLKKEGFNIWIDQEDIRAGSEWDLEIEKALETCDCLLFIETEKSVSSNNVLDEVYYALEEHKKVIPLILVDSKTPFRLQRLQHIDFTKDYNAGLSLLIKELKNDAPAELLMPEEDKPVVKPYEPIFKKYSALILIISLVILIVAAAAVFTLNKKNATPVSNPIANSGDTINSEHKTVETGSKEISKNDIISKEEKSEGKVNGEEDHKKVNKINNEIINRPDNKVEDLNETFAGDWKLVNVEPKAESINGYLKINVIDEKKVSIKSYFQFYYFKSNDTSFLSVFNGFAGCSSCILEKDMKITAEDIAIGSHAYKILKQDQHGEGKAGDTVMNAGANKSIRASVTLHLINNNTAIIKVQQSAATELSHGLVLQPFVYSFNFTKVED